MLAPPPLVSDVVPKPLVFEGLSHLEMCMQRQEQELPVICASQIINEFK